MLNFFASETKYLFFLRLAYFLFLFYLFVICSRFRLEKMLKLLSGGVALIIFVYGILQKFILFPWILERIDSGPSFYSHALRVRITSGRIFAIFPLPTLYAMICGLMLIFIVHYLLHARLGAEKVFWSILLFLGACNLVLTQSFGGILFFTAGIMFYLFASRVFKVKYLAPLLMVLALVLFLVIALRFSEAREMAPAKLRFSNWQQAGRVIASAPVLGVGLGNYETAVAPHVRPGEPASIYAHNFFLQLAAETGLPLFLLLIVICLPFVKKGIPGFLKPENALFASACILILFFNMFDVGSFFIVPGISFVVMFSQVAKTEGPSRPYYFIIAVLLAVLLLADASAVDRQRSADFWLSRQDLARAEAGYRSALTLNPFSYRTWLGLAHIAWQRNDFPEAERLFRKVLGIFPGQAFANFRLSQAAQRRGAYLTALLHARRAANANKLNKEYRKWHEYIKSNLAKQLQIPGN